MVLGLDKNSNFGRASRHLYEKLKKVLGKSVPLSKNHKAGSPEESANQGGCRTGFRFPFFSLVFSLNRFFFKQDFNGSRKVSRGLGYLFLVLL